MKGPLHERFLLGLGKYWNRTLLFPFSLFGSHGVHKARPKSKDFVGWRGCDNFQPRTSLRPTGFERSARPEPRKARPFEGVSETSHAVGEVHFALLWENYKWPSVENPGPMPHTWNRETIVGMYRGLFL